MSNIDSITFFFNLQKRLHLFAKDWPATVAWSIVPSKHAFNQLGVAFNYIKVSDLNSFITTDILSDKEEYTKQFSGLIDSIITSGESLFAPLLFGPDQAELSKLRNKWPNNLLSSKNASGLNPTGISLVHLLFDFMYVLRISVGNSTVSIAFSVNASGFVSSAYYIVQ